MKKTVAILVTAAILMGSTTTALASTTTSSSTDAIIAQLQAQIADLMTKIAALKQAQSNVQTAQQNVAGTMKLIGNLREGMSGDQVKLLQTILAGDKTIYPEGTISGYYGPLTREAVKRFQKEHGIESTGFTGPKTMSRINELLSQTPLMRNDDRNDDTTATTTTGAGNTERERNRIMEHSEFCIAVPPGHLIAPGWRKHHEGDDEDPVLPRCGTIPPGIWGQMGGSTTTPPAPTPTTTPDTIAPVLSAVTSTVTGSTTATVGWTTNEAATSKVYYGTTTPVDMNTALVQSDATLVTTHTMNLSGLSASTTYYMIPESRDAANNVGTSSQISFTTTQ